MVDGPDTSAAVKVDVSIVIPEASPFVDQSNSTTITWAAALINRPVVSRTVIGSCTSTITSAAVASGEGLGEALVDELGLTLEEGLVVGLGLLDGLTDALGLSEGDGDELGLTLGEGETLGLTDGEALGDGEALDDGLRLADGLCVGLTDDEGERLADGDCDADTLDEGDTEALGLGLLDTDDEGDTLADGLRLALVDEDGLGDGETLGETDGLTLDDDGSDAEKLSRWIPVVRLPRCTYAPTTPLAEIPASVTLMRCTPSTNRRIVVPTMSSVTR